MSAVFDDHRHRDLRRLDRCERDKERVIAQPLRRSMFVVARSLRDSFHLRGAGFACDMIGRVVADAVRGASIRVHDIH